MQSYLDHNASAPLLDEAKIAMLAAMDQVGNPSSVHREGRKARKTIEDSRQNLADVANVEANQIIFTSGATEAAQTVLGTRIRFGSTNIAVSHLYISSIEHPCVLAGGRFGPDQITKFGVDESGVVDLVELENVLAQHDHSIGAPLVALMLANNETGVIQPVREAGEIVKANRGYLCVDAVQAFGKYPVKFSDLGAHFVLISAHKIGGPKGIGAIIRMDKDLAPYPLIRGGGQENLSRAGTENVVAIAGFGAAVTKVIADLGERHHIGLMRDRMEFDLEELSRGQSNKVPLPVFFGGSQFRLDNTSCFAVDGIKAETALIALDLEGISVSSGSACSSGRVNQSHVLSAMGVEPELAECTLRLSIGHQTTNEQTQHFLNVWQ
ncbi:MAG: cysteine desulfurase, partial [Hyphomicrobiales bacterium]|nr:cysteine desulfurase [Hyphomicrobiales bacterium]